jgi:hypothetical protein
MILLSTCVIMGFPPLKAKDWTVAEVAVGLFLVIAFEDVKGLLVLVLPLPLSASRS